MDSQAPPDASSVPVFGSDAPRAGRASDPDQDVRAKAPRRERRAGDEGGPEGEPEEPLRGLYFVRVPKPDLGDEATVARLEQEFEVRAAAAELLKETRRLKRIERNEAHANTRRALEALKAAKALVKAKEADLQPYWDRVVEARSASQALKGSRSELDAETEADLDKKIAALEYSMEHESHGLREEKELIARIRKLKAQRPKVREYEAAHQHLQERRVASDDVRGSKESLEKELRVLRDERKQCEEVKKGLLAVEEKIMEGLKKIEEEVDEAVTEKNAWLSKLKGAKSARWAKMADWNQNRDFSRKVRNMVAEGRIEEAQVLCNEYSEKLMEKLNTDKEYRTKYLTLWERQRKTAMVTTGVSDADLGVGGAKRQGKKAAAGSILDIPLKPGQTRAEAVIERALREADAELKGIRPADAGAASADDAEPAEVKVAKKDKPAKKVAAPKDMGRSLVVEDKAAAKASKVDTTFEIPEAIRAKEELPVVVAPKVEDPEELQKRKDRRKAQAEKRRQRAIEQNKVREEEKRRLKEDSESKAAARR
eukprot:evm.model.scf_1110.1 EVM.evm.TU.scf_1110.1   scf_1110:15-2914(-)